MPLPDLYIIVEGDDDLRFFKDDKVKRALSDNYSRYARLHVIKFVHRNADSRKSLFDTIKGTSSDYIFVRDNDGATCVSSRKEEIVSRFGELALDRRRILIVKKEIESWYIAGVTNEFCRRNRISPEDDTEQFGKRKFDNLIPRDCRSRISFMVDIMKTFSFDDAARRNSSFAYFMRKYAP